MHLKHILAIIRYGGYNRNDVFAKGIGIYALAITWSFQFGYLSNICNK